MSGPPPKPHGLKVLNGHPGKKGKAKQNRKPLEFTKGKPKCPEWLDNLAKAEWDDVVKELEAKGLLMKVDWFLIAAYCHYATEWYNLQKKIKKEGRTYDSSKTKGVKMLRPNPDIKLANDAYKIARQLLTDLSLSPSARARLLEPIDESKMSPLERLLSGKKKK